MRNLALLALLSLVSFSGAWAQTDDPDPIAFVVMEKEPEVLNLDSVRKVIGYPKVAFEAGIEGRVIVRVMVDEQGRANKHVVFKDPHTSLTEAVTAQIHHLRFTPGILHGKPTKCWITMPFSFQLNR